MPNTNKISIEEQIANRKALELFTEKIVSFHNIVIDGIKIPDRLDFTNPEISQESNSELEMIDKMMRQSHVRTPGLANMIGKSY